MGIKTPEEFRESLRDGRVVYIDGEKVDDVTTHPKLKVAVETAGQHLKDLRIAEVEKLDMKIEDGKVVGYRAKVNVSFKYQSSA